MPCMFLEKPHDKKALAENLPVFQDMKVIFSDDAETAYLEEEIVKRGIQLTRHWKRKQLCWGIRHILLVKAWIRGPLS